MLGQCRGSFAPCTHNIFDRPSDSQHSCPQARSAGPIELQMLQVSLCQHLQLNVPQYDTATRPREHTRRRLCFSRDLYKYEKTLKWTSAI